MQAAPLAARLRDERAVNFHIHLPDWHVRRSTRNFWTRFVFEQLFLAWRWI